MSHNGRIILYAIALAATVIAAVMDCFQSKRVTVLALLAACLAIDNFVWLKDAG